MAADVHGDRRPRPGTGVPTSSARSSPAGRSRARRRCEDDGDHPLTWRSPSRHLLRRRRLPGAGVGRAAEGVLRRGDQDGGGRRRERDPEYGVGGGITWDSIAGREYDETVAKARVLRPHGVRRSSSSSRCGANPGGPIRRLERHVERLHSSAAYLGFAFDEAAVRATMDARPPRAPIGRQRSGCAYFAGRCDRGLERPALDRGARTVRLELDDVAVDPADVFLFHKTTMRRPYDDARARRPTPTTRSLSRAGAGHRTSVANIAAKLDGRWSTPPLDAGLLPGPNARRCSRTGRWKNGDLHRRGADRGRPRRVQLGARLATRRARGLRSDADPVDRERNGASVFIHRAGAERAAGRFLVDQHRALAERAGALTHRQR